MIKVHGEKQASITEFLCRPGQAARKDCARACVKYARTVRTAAQRTPREDLQIDMYVCLLLLVLYFCRVAKDEAIQFYNAGATPRLARAIERAERSERAKIAAELRALNGDTSQPSEDRSVSSEEESEDDTDPLGDSDGDESGSNDGDGGSVSGGGSGQRAKRKGRMGSNGSVVVEEGNNQDEEEEIYWSEAPSGVFASSSSSSEEEDDSDRKFSSDFGGSEDGDGAGEQGRRRRRSLVEPIVVSTEPAAQEGALVCSQSEGQDARHSVEGDEADDDDVMDVVGQAAAAADSSPVSIEAAAEGNADGGNGTDGKPDTKGPRNSREEGDGYGGENGQPPAVTNSDLDGSGDEDIIVVAPVGTEARAAGGLFNDDREARDAGNQG